jgi:hypothetical protein
MMMRRVHWAMAALVAVVLSACQTMEQVPYDRASAGNIKTINVITPKAPDRPAVVLASTVGQSFGLVGALIDAGMQSSRESDFETAMKTQNFIGNDAFVRHLDGALTSGGYAPAHSSVKRETQGFLKAYPKGADVQGDAHLDVVMHYGYIASGMSTPYRPFVSVNVKLVRASDSALLMQKSIFYNPLNGAPENTVTIAPDPTYEFTDFDALTADPAKAAKGLDTAIAQVATAMGTLLK